MCRAVVQNRRGDVGVMAGIVNRVLTGWHATMDYRFVIPAQTGIQCVQLREAAESLILRMGLRTGFQPALE